MLAADRVPRRLKQTVSSGWYCQNGRSPTPTLFRPFSKSPKVTYYLIPFAGCTVL